MTKKRTILVVDDDEPSRTAQCAMLRALGFDSIGFGDPREVVEKLGGQPIDLALLDIMMPYMTGIELLEELRKVPAYQSIPIFMVTARDSEEDVLEGYKHGADYYITKPYTTKQLQYGIDLYLSSDAESEEAP